MTPTPPADRDPTRRDVTLVSCMRNEGLFIVEWVACHSLMGFADILVFTNNCTDGSDLLLDRLEELGHLTHIRHDPAPGLSPQIEAMKLAFQHPKVLAHEWLLHIDSDEFLHVNTGDGTVGALIDATAPADVVAIGWKCFGNSGKTRWDGGSVLQTFTRSQGRPMRRIAFHKSLYRHRLFQYGTDHMPKMPKRDDVRVVTTAGTAFDPSAISHPRKSRYRLKFSRLTYTNAAIHHYVIKSDDLYLMKNDRGDGHGMTHTKYHIHSDAYGRHNRNEVEDTSILTHWPAIAERMALLRSDPEIARLESACNADFRARRDRVLTPEQIAAWTFPPRNGADADSPDEGEE